MNEKTTIRLFYGTTLLLLFVFSFTDMQISMALYRPQNAVWRFFEAFGEWPLNALAAISALFLWQTEPRVTLLQRFVAYWGWGLTTIVCTTLAGSLPLYFLTRDSSGNFPLWVILGAPIAFAVSVALVRQLSRSVNRINGQLARSFAFVAVFYFWAAQFVAHSVKIFWGRVRFRDLSQTFAEFSAWYHPQGITGNYSFPSGHALNAAAVLLLPLLPRVFPDITVKVRTLVIFASFWMILVATSRVGLGAHFPSDVTAGALLGVSLILILKHQFFDTPMKTDPEHYSQKREVRR